MAVTWPRGFRSVAADSGIKGSGLDLGILTCDRPRTWAGVFTLNAAAAAPVQWCRALQDRDAQALVVNSGNANACTGRSGQEAVERTAAAVAARVGCSSENVLIASTGPIGVPLPIEKIESGVATAGPLAEDVLPFARSILTTDSAVKTAERKVGPGRVVGVAKGAAMVAPNMATMLAFIATDLHLERRALRAALRTAVDRSFNRISVDGCESTNDSVFLFASGMAGPAPEGFEAALTEVCRSLAEQIVRDAEGGSKLVRIRVEDARSEDHAVSLGRGIAASALWRAAAHGEDPNWGRILSAVGSVDRSWSPDGAELWIGSELVFHKGEPGGSLEVASKEMGEGEVAVRLSVGSGRASAEILTADLSPEYVRLNAEGST